MVRAEDKIGHGESVLRRVKADGVLGPVVNVDQVAVLAEVAQGFHRRAEVFAQFRRGEVFRREAERTEEQIARQQHADGPRQPAGTRETRGDGLHPVREEESQGRGEEKDHSPGKRIEGQERCEQGEEKDQEQEKPKARESARESDQSNQK